jgi:hypothetical protein
MNPELLVKLANQRTDELKDTATAAHASRSCRPRDSIRQRIGWAMVQVGLRLALPARQTRRQVAH